jgi:hypothetical protein
MVGCHLPQGARSRWVATGECVARFLPSWGRCRAQRGGGGYQACWRQRLKPPSPASPVLPPTGVLFRDCATVCAHAAAGYSFTPPSGGSTARRAGRGVRPWSRQRFDPLRLAALGCLPLRGEAKNRTTDACVATHRDRSPNGARNEGPVSLCRATAHRGETVSAPRFVHPLQEVGVEVLQNAS